MNKPARPNTDQNRLLETSAKAHLPLSPKTHRDGQELLFLCYSRLNRGRAHTLLALNLKGMQHSHSRPRKKLLSLLSQFNIPCTCSHRIYAVSIFFYPYASSRMANSQGEKKMGIRADERNGL